LKILHITESYGGGVTSAINTYAINSACYEHHLFASIREGDSTGEENNQIFKSSSLAPRSLKSLFTLYKYMKSTSPDIIHLHSTYAGFFCRLLPFIPKDKIIYTPHGFAYLRNSHWVLKKLFYFIEKMLTKRTNIIAGCGKDERIIGEKLIGNKNAFELINVCDDLSNISSWIYKVDKPVVVMVGRLTAQKGVDFFYAVAKQLKTQAHFVWIGGGTSSSEELLKSVGVEITGWCERQQVLSYLKGADLYFHTGAWEGFPISVLEAAKLKKAIILRKIGPFTAENLFTVNTIVDAQNEIKLVLSGNKNAVDRALKNSTDIESYHSLSNLQNALIKLYSNFNK
jgi:glycosyltransferase involved in cell wall biosynthesis